MSNMKIQLDFNQKLISIEQNANAHDVYKAIKKILPDWKDWTIQAQSIVYNPIVYTPLVLDQYIPGKITTTGGETIYSDVNVN